MTDLVGHAHAVRQIQTGWEAGVTAFIVLGERGLGKTTLVRHCAAQLYGSLDHSDLIEYRPSGASLGVAQMREIIDGAFVVPSTDFKLVIIHSAERFTVEAADVLLKTLEEGTGATRFLLTGADPSRVRPTILSRCEHVQLTRLTDVEVREVLVGLSIEDDSGYTKIGRGVPGRAVRAALGSLEAVRMQAERVISQLLICPLWEIMSLCDDVAKEMLRDFIEEMMSVTLDATANGPDGPDEQDLLESFGGHAWVLMEELSDLHRVSSASINLREHLSILLHRSRSRIKALQKVKS